MAKDEDAVEWVLLGKGIGFGKQAGDQIEISQIDRRFKAQVDGVTHQNPPEMLANIDPTILQLASMISEHAANFLEIRFSNYNYLALADHIAFAIKRAQTTDDYPKDFRWEVQRLYPKEYQAAQQALVLIKDRLGVQLPISELTFFTYHFVSAQSSGTLVADTVEMTSLINRIVEIISYHFQKQIDTSSLNYARFMTHLRYFVIRQMHHEQNGEEIDPMIGEVVRNKYPKAYAATQKIATYLEQTKNWQISSSERMYLTLHVWRLTR